MIALMCSIPPLASVQSPTVIRFSPEPFLLGNNEGSKISEFFFSKKKGYNVRVKLPSLESFTAGWFMLKTMTFKSLPIYPDEAIGHV
jgi:hypothetical protein